MRKIAVVPMGFVLLAFLSASSQAGQPKPPIGTPMTAVSKVSGIKFVDSTDYDQSQFSFINDGPKRMTAYHCTLTENSANGKSVQRDVSGEFMFFYLDWKAETRVRPWMKPRSDAHIIAPGEKNNRPFIRTENPKVVSASVLCDVAVYEDGTAESANDAALQAIINRRIDMAKHEDEVVQAATAVQAKTNSVADLHSYTKEHFKGNAQLENELSNLENNRSIQGGEHTAKNDPDKLSHFITDHKMRQQAWTTASKITAVGQ